MTGVLQFALLGLGAGAIYALLGQGLVLIFKGSGILNLAHGGFAMAAAFMYYELHTVHGNGTALSMLITVAAVVIVGVGIDQLLLRHLRGASALARLIATMGVLLALQSGGVIRYGTYGDFAAAIFPPHDVHIFGAIVSSDRLWLLGVAVAVTGVLTLVWRFSRLGWVMSAVSENPDAAAAHGWSPEFVSACTWAIGAGLAAIAGILIAPITQLSVDSLSLLIIPALAAALLGGFRSYPLTLVGGVAIGIMGSLVQRYVNVPGASTALPFLLIALFMLGRGSVLPLRGYITDRPPRLGTGQIRPVVVLGGSALGALLVAFVFNDNWLTATMDWFAVAVILLSLVVVVGYAGQLSLAQYALAGIGALIAARLVQAGHWTFVPALLVGTIGAMAVGLLFALPALRTRGVELAVVTLGLAVAADALLFNNGTIIGTAEGTQVGSPHVFGLDIDAFNHPVSYALVTLLVFTLCALAVANLRRGRSGRRMAAIRTNERAAAAMGISVFEAKLHAFAVGGALAGLGGVLLAFQTPNVVYTRFDPFASLSAVAEAVIGGVGFVLGPLFGALVDPGSLSATIVSGFWSNAPEYLPLIGGLGVLVTLLVHRDGFVSAMSTGARRAFDRWLRGPAQVSLALSDVQVRRVEAKRLEVSELGVRYGGVVAVQGVSLSVEPGEIVGLIGPNGAGKTSAIDAIAGFAGASGHVTLSGTRIEALPPHRRARLGLVRSFQSLELFEDMTVLENLRTASEPRDRRAMITDLFRPGAPALPPVAVAAVREFQLEGVLGRRPGEISYGQRRLAAIARAVAMEPSVLLLDEPVAGLDDAESREFAHLVRRLADEWGIAVLVVEHDMNFVMGICDRLLVMDFGRPVVTGTPDEVRSDPRAIAAYLGEKDEPASEVA